FEDDVVEMKYQKSIIKATVRDASDGGTPERRRKIRRRKKTSTRQFILSWKTSDIVPQQNLDQDGNSLVQDGIRLGLRTPTEMFSVTSAESWVIKESIAKGT
ncbi:hypothetical protein F441_11701, partial [Phytophthora nicotianae CJ01A1]